MQMLQADPLRRPRGRRRAGGVEDRLLAVQYLRGIAALMVVVQHALNPQPWLWTPKDRYDAFAWGVDVFFAISGFIMVAAAASDSPGRFLLKRGIRIVPLYWAMTLLALVVAEHQRVLRLPWEQWGSVLLSLFFVPQYSLAEPGRIYPYLIPGWTLNFEVFFYLLFAVGLLLRRPLLFSAVAIGVLTIAGWVLHPHDPVLATYTSPRMLEFLAGAIVGHCYRRGLLGRPLLSLVAPVGFAGLFALPLLQDDATIFAGRVLCATLILVGTVSLGRWTPRWRLGALIGDASYSIYLTHTVVALLLAYEIGSRVLDPVDGPLQLALYLLLAVVLSVVVGIASYRFVERPSLVFLRARLLTRRSRSEGPLSESAASTPRGDRPFESRPRDPEVSLTR